MSVSLRRPLAQADWYSTELTELIFPSLFGVGVLDGDRLEPVELFRGQLAVRVLIEGWAAGGVPLPTATINARPQWRFPLPAVTSS
jgi:hypothetical protein